MDEPRIDVIAKRLSAGFSRRRVVGGLSGGLAAVGALLRPKPAPAGGCKKVGKLCDKNQDCCDHAECKGGECKCKSGWKECGGGVCVNRDTDESHCGHCGTVCGEDEVCDGGECTCKDGWQDCAGDGTCANLDKDENHCGACGNACGLLTCCDGECVALPYDRDHCGACDNGCGEDEVCVHGGCVPCLPPDVICGDQCCGAGVQICENGQCQRVLP
jgi:hypothetical protein